MLLAELEIWHSKPAAPTRRLALGHLVLPVDPPPGFGGLLLAAVIAANANEVNSEDRLGSRRLLDQVVGGERVVQPRLAHRFQVDRHGLSTSVHRMVSNGEQASFSLHATGRPLAQVLGAIYALERLDPDVRAGLHDVLARAMRWTGPIGPAFIANMAGSTAHTMVTRANPRAWALDVLGFDGDHETLGTRDVMRHYRRRLRAIHPDHGGDVAAAAGDIEELNEARRILLQ